MEKHFIFNGNSLNPDQIILDNDGNEFLCGNLLKLLPNDKKWSGNGYQQYMIFSPINWLMNDKL